MGRRGGILLPPFTGAVAGLALALGAPAGAAAQAVPAGGASADPAPVVTRVACRARCSGAAARTGSALAVTGSGLRDVVSVTFTGSPLAGDEVTVAPRRASAHRVRVDVPAGAVRGPLVVTDAAGVASAPSRAVRIRRPAVPLDGGGPIATVVPARKAFVDGVRPPSVTYELRTAEPADVTVSVVGGPGDPAAPVASFDQGRVEPGERRTVEWNGRIGRVPAPEGRYAFVVDARVPGSGAFASSGADAEAGFLLLEHRFPVRGKHDYGGFVAGFGGGREHEGQDVFAACGTPLVAARGGVVKMKRYQQRAGNYVVIDGGDGGVDMVYMHLRDPALVDQGERVRTGQRIGFVGDTGRATGCHLHFEEWSAPGWYTGGSPFDPLPDLQAWDAVS